MKVGRKGTIAVIGLLVLASACTTQNEETAPTTPTTPTAITEQSVEVVDTASSPTVAATTPDSGSVAPDVTVSPTVEPTEPGLSADNGNAASTTGITAESINIAYLGVDFSTLEGTGLVPELGDQQKQVQGLVDEINANGGIAGRQINLYFKLLDLLNSGPDIIQAECIAATQEFEAAIVVLPPAAARDMARCTAVTNETLTMQTTAFDASMFVEAQGRLFASGGMNTNRQFRAWAKTMSDLGYLDGKTIGIVVGDRPVEFTNAVNDTLVPELEALGHAPVEVITLPCSSSSCEQYDVAATKMQEAGVDTVFLQLANTLGPGFVQAADDIDYHPQWLLEGNQVTDTVLSFYESVNDSLAGAIGVGFSFALAEDINPLAVECNNVVTERSGESYESGSDAFGFTANICTAFTLLQTAGETLVDQPLDQGTLIAAIEGVGVVVNGNGPPGSLSSTKHDGSDYLYLCDFDVATGKCVRRSDPPFKVPA